MGVLLGILAICFLWLLAVPAAIFGLLWFARPRPKTRPIKATPPPKTSPAYVRRWGLPRKHAVSAEKADWEKDFDRLTAQAAPPKPPSPTPPAPHAPRASARPAAPDPTPTPTPAPAARDQRDTFQNLRENLDSLR